MTHQQRSTLESALRYLGRSTKDLYAVHSNRCVIHGMVMASICGEFLTNDMDEVDNASRKLWMRDCHLIPESGMIL